MDDSPAHPNVAVKAAYKRTLERPLKINMERALASGDPQAVMDALTGKQRSFVEEYLVDLNAAAALRRSGYRGAETSLAKMANDMLTHRGVRFAIDYLKAQRAEKSDVTSDYVIREIVGIVENVKGENPQAALRGLELLAKHLGMFIERTEITGKDGEALKYEKVREDANDFTSAIAKLAERERAKRMDGDPERRAEG